MRKILFNTISACMLMASGSLNAQANPGVFVHLFEWSWNDIAAECPRLAELGYDGVQVSPINETIVHPTWWTRYQPVTFDKFDSRSGTKDELLAMIEACDDVDIKIYVDAVINHTADYGGEGVGTAGTAWSLMNHPGLTAQNYHSDCTIQDFTKADETQNCKLGALPDLDTSQESVRVMLSDYLVSMEDMGVAGFRIDAAKHMAAADIEAIVSELDSDTYLFLEVIGNPDAELPLQPQSYEHIGAVTDFDFRGHIYAAVNGDIDMAREVFASEQVLADENAVTFVDNHDTERHTSEMTLEQKRLAEALLLSAPYGYPKVMSGYFFDDRDQLPAEASVDCEGEVWTCWHRDPVVAAFVKQRADWDDSEIRGFRNDGGVISFQRGKTFVVFNLTGESKVASVTPDFDQGSYCDFVGDTGARLFISLSGAASVGMPAYGAAVFKERSRRC